MLNKVTLRKEFLQKRQAFIPFKKPFDQKIFQKFINLPQVIKAKTICFYVSLPDEVDTHELIKYYLGKKRVVVPRVKGKNLQLYEIKSWEDLTEGKFNILEPNFSHTTYYLLHTTNIDLFVVPGIVFSKSGQRIGFGKGYYDRLLENVRGDKLGLAYDWQVLEEIPETISDIKIDMILTPDKLFTHILGHLKDLV